MKFIWYAVIMFFSGVALGTKDTQPETSVKEERTKKGDTQANKQLATKDDQPFLGELRDYGHKKLSGALKSAQAHPVLTLGIAGALALFAYQKNPLVYAKVNKGVRDVKNFVQYKVFLPGYIKYEEIKENGLTAYEWVMMGLILGAWWSLKRINERYNVVGLTKKIVGKSIQEIESFWHNHPRIVLGLLSALGLTAFTFRMYKAAALPFKTRSLTPMDLFLFRSGGKIRNALLAHEEVQDLVSKGSLEDLFGSESFNDLMTTLSDDQQAYIYSLINDYQQATYEAV